MSSILVSRMEALDESDLHICVFCDEPVVGYVCPLCEEYKGIMTREEWEAYTGEVWE